MVGLNGLEPSTSRLSGVRSNHLSYAPSWWRWGDSNPWPPACRAGALPAELHPHFAVAPAWYLQNWTILLSTSFPCWHSDAALSCSLLRKEVIQPHLPIRLPCYDFTPVINPTFDSALLAVRLLASGVTDSHGVTGGVYKARERIHRSMLICDY